MPPGVGAQFSGGEFDVFRYKCPDPCSCVPDVVDDRHLVITCKLDSLNGEDFAADFPKNATKALTIRCTNPRLTSVFTDDMFQGFTNLRDLRISNCLTPHLPANIFRGLVGLRMLQLSRLSEKKHVSLAPAVFHPITGLEKLAITDCSIQQFGDNVFCPLANLQILNVTGNRLPTARLDSTSCPLPQLVILDFSGNVIERIASTDLQGFPSLRQLVAVGNGLHAIELGAFADLPALQHVDFEDNALVDLPLLPAALLHVNLARNQLEFIPASVANLDKLVSLNVSDNLITTGTPFALTGRQLETLDISRNRFDVVPSRLFAEAQPSLLYLYVAGNQIAVLQAGQLVNLTRLQKLDLSNNKITSLFESSFSGPSDLVDLDLSANKIYRIDVGVFGDVARRLQRISLAGNMLHELPTALSRLSKVRELDLSHNVIVKLYKFVLNKLDHLQRLDLSHNRISTVESYVFADCPHLSELSLATNRIDSIAGDAFEKCPHLKAINVADNRLTTCSGALAELKALRLVNVSGNQLTAFDWREFPDEVLEVDASRNLIDKVLTATPSKAKKINLNNNTLTHLSEGQLNSDLESITLRHNRISRIDDGVFASLRNIKQIDLRDNALRFITRPAFRDTEQGLVNGLLTTQLWVAGNPLECSCEMTWIASLSSKTAVQLLDGPDAAVCSDPVQPGLVRALTSTKPSDFLCRYEQACEPGCICCQYGNCDCKSKCPDGCDCFHDSDFSTNVVQCKSLNSTAMRAFSPKGVPMKATHVFLEGLQLPVLHNHDFTSRARLVELRINASGVEDIQAFAFNALPSLKHLDLSSNRLRQLQGDELFKCQRLVSLNLADNRIDEADIRLAEHLPNLAHLRLEGNLFDELPEWVVQTPLLKSVTFGGNPFRCDCDFTRFRIQSWISDNIDRVPDAQDMRCVENVTRSIADNDTTVLSTFPPNEDADLFVMPLLDFVNNANLTLCNVNAGGFFGGGPESNVFLVAVAVAFLFMATCGLIFVLIAFLRRSQAGQNRYKRATPSLSTTTPGSSPLPVPLLPQYDAFVSYAKLDEEQVLTQLCKPLENEDYSLCYLHQGGHTAYSVHAIDDELLRQLEACQALIIFVTRNFLRQEWRAVQIRTSHRVFAKLRNKKLISILDDDICANDLDNDLGHILRKHTCVRRSDPLFWSLVLSSMPVRLSHLHSTGSTTLCDGSDIYSEMYGSVVPSDVV